MVERDRRVVVRCPVDYWRGDTLVRAETEDLSEHGVFVRTEEFLPRGHVLDLQFRLPSGEYVRQRASVAHILPHGVARAVGRQPGMGFEFYGWTSDELLEMLHRAEDELPVPMPEPQGLSVLIADASTPIFERLATILGAAGHRVHTAATGRDALARCRQAPPDVMLIDVALEDMTAWEVMDALAADPALASIPVGMMGQAGDDLARLKAYRRGVEDFVQKPFTDEEIAVRVARLAQRPVASPSSAALTGDLSVLGLPVLLSMFDYERVSGTLSIERPAESIRLLVSEGRVVRLEGAAVGDPLRRLFDALDWSEGAFRFVAGEVTGEDQIELRTQQILIEHAQSRDESSGDVDLDGAFAEVETEA